MSIRIAIRTVRMGLANLRYWLPIIWRDRWWDREYIYRLLGHKFRRDAALYRASGHCEDAEVLAGQMETAACLCGQLDAEEYEGATWMEWEAARATDTQTLFALLTAKIEGWWD